jgi:DNA polymerase-3 subunit delta
MRLSAERLPGHLAEGLGRLYTVHGEEPLQVRESLDALRAAARAAGFDERVVLDADAQFPWERLQAELGSLSLFGARRLVEVRLPGGKPGRDGGAALAGAAGAVPDDVVLLVACGALDRDAQRSAWLRALEHHGVLVEARPVPWTALPEWLRQRGARHQVTLTEEAAELLAERTEGNLLAADQELARLRLLTGGGTVGADAVLEATTDSARFGLSELEQAVLAGDRPRALKALHSLQAEDAPKPLVLWALARCARVQAMVTEGAAEAAYTAHKVFGGQRRRYGGLPRRVPERTRLRLVALAGEADAAVKGLLDRMDPWLALERLALALALVHGARSR